jgi:hypothetical protein
MVLNILETLKKPIKAFLKFITIRVVLESFLVKLTTFLNFSNENESKRFSKNHTRDFIKKSSYDLNNSLNNLGRNFSMTSIAETLIGKKIEVKTPDYLFVRIHKDKK